MLLHRLIAKQSKKEQTHLACLHAVENYEKVESINTQNDLVTASKKMRRKKENIVVLLFRNCVNVFKFQENSFKIVEKNF